MNRSTPLVAVLGIALAGCALHPGRAPRAPGDRSVFVDNSAAFDAYLTRRTDDLLRMGATKDRSAAESQARSEAARRYGPRTPAAAAAWSVPTRRGSRALTASELDQALGK
jgi:hypothetical protein